MLPEHISQKLSKAEYAKLILTSNGESMGTTLVWEGMPYNSGYKTYFPSGQLYSTGTLKNYNLDGHRVCYFKNGFKQSEANYKDGVVNGAFKEYYKNGQLQTEATYVNGLVEGEVMSYTRHGQVREALHYKAGKLQGALLQDHRFHRQVEPEITS